LRDGYFGIDVFDRHYISDVPDVHYDAPAFEMWGRHFRTRTSSTGISLPSPARRSISSVVQRSEGGEVLVA